MSDHAMLSASGAHRWLNCTPSALIERDMPDTSSEFAKEGTAAHALAEHKLRKALKLKTRKPRSKYHDAAMEEYTDDYAQFCLERLANAKQTCGDPVLLIEERLDFSDFVPEGFGTGDCVIVAEPRLEVIDLKYGMGVNVEAEENPQMMLYGLGALSAFDALYDIDTVAMTVYQPRRNNVSTWEISAKELKQWAKEYVAPRAEKAFQGEGEFNPGDWCIFCPINATCRTRADKQLEILKYDFAENDELDDDEIADILSRSAELKKWLSAVESYALETALSGEKTWPGFKVVAGRAVRKYADDKAIERTLLDAGFNEDDFYQKKLVGIGAMEKLLGKKRFAELLNDYIAKPPGKPALVPETDKRPALELTSVKDDFNIED